MMTTKNMPVMANNDAELVSGTLAGNRDAFSQIVSRYQSLICSLAYSATGSLGQSEDLAQETFITAWKHLGHLRERDKLRAWLCGIARNRINNFLRREGREPSHRADSIEEVPESHSPEPLPVEHTITNEEQAILWRSLERIPELYREPLVLFYREHQSIEAVAEKLELTEDTVKQRLSRGRKLLHEQVLAFVEGALERTNPGKTFTLAVLAAIPATLGTSAKAAAIGMAAAKGGAAAKGAGAMGLLGILLSPVMILFGNYLPYRIGMAEARSEEERYHIKRFFRRIWGWSFALSLVVVAGLWLAFRSHATGDFGLPAIFMCWFVSFVVLYLFLMFGFSIAHFRHRRAFYQHELDAEHGGVFPKPVFEYCSPVKFLGLPLIHIRIGDRYDFMRKPVFGWFALGNYAFGGLAAFGGVAVAPFSVGALALGFISYGGLVAGIFPLGGLALGVWAFGGIPIGWQAIGGFAFAWNQAVGGFAVAHDFACGNIAHAMQANNDIARQMTEANGFFRFAQMLSRHWFWTNLLWITPLFIQWRLIARARARREQENA